MPNSKKLLQAASGSAGGDPLDIDEVFSTFLYTGNGSSQTITNGIDLSGEGGLVWTKRRGDAVSHTLFDTERGATKRLFSNLTNAETTESTALTSFNSNGFSVGSAAAENNNGSEIVSWTFRKAPKFFDIVTWTGTGGSRTLNHNLGSTIGMIIVKDYSNAGENWTVYHRGIDVNGDNAPETDGIYLNTTGAAFDESGFWNDTAPTSTQFTVGGNLNSSFGGGANYVAYLFAHNDSGDGEFGPDSDADVIKCDTYTGNGSTTGPVIDCGFEPQWLMVKCSSDSGSGFVMMDNMRGFTADAAIQRLETYSSNGEAAKTYIGPTSTGFQPKTTDVTVNGSGKTYIYMAIRRGPLAAPDDATKVFSMDTQGSSAPYFDSNHIVDMSLVKALTITGDWDLYTRLLGEKSLATNTAAVEATASEAGFDFMNGHIDTNWGSGFPRSSMWKRAPEYFDVVAYTGTGSATTVSHNLGVAPEMMWVKRRDDTGNWLVYHSGLTSAAYRLFLNGTNAEGILSSAFNSTAPTDSVFTVGDNGSSNATGGTYIAYLFATVAGVSKVGNFSLSGSDIDVDCGFSSGARWVMIKRTDGTGNWFQFDTLRGFGVDNDSTIYLNTTDDEELADYIDPLSSGFSIESSSWDNGDYIFYAIA